MCLILVSCVMLALDSESLQVYTRLQQTLVYLDYITTALYTVELIAQVIAMGLLLHPGSYLRNQWNCLESAIVFVSLLSYGYPQLQYLRALRALRPLRIISRVHSAKVVMVSLWKSIATSSNVFLVSLVLMVSLSVCAVQLFQGQLQACYSVTTGKLLEHELLSCSSGGGVWVNPTNGASYDNMLQSMLAMFEMCTEERWPEAMYTAVDSTGVYGTAPVIDSHQNYGIFFICCIFIMSSFIKNLFAATIVDGYSKFYAEITGVKTNHLQSCWLDFYKLAVTLPPPLSELRRKYR